MPLRKILLFIICGLGFSHSFTQTTDSLPSKKMPLEIPEVKWKWNKEGTRYLRFAMIGQVWVRYTQDNPGTLFEDKAKANQFDIGLRRFRMQVYAQPIEWLFIYTQFGINSFNALSPRKAGDFFHDAVVEFTPVKKYLSIGAGLTGWTGLSRFSSPSVTNGLMPDPPQYQLSTLDVEDQNFRKLSIYVKGKIAALDYRLILSDPFSYTTAAGYNAAISKDAQFTHIGKSVQFSGYLMYQFLDKENNLLPFNAGTYLGSKKIINIGAGFEYQPGATWNLENSSDTVFHPLILASGDFYADLPLIKSKDDCFTSYLAYSYYNFGPRYIRNIGSMNPANKVDAALASFNGAGNAYPLIGTGHTFYALLAYKLPAHFFGSSGFSIQPYIGIQNSKWEKLSSWMVNVDAGINFLIIGNKAKISLNYQNRPVFDAVTLKRTKRMNGLYTALQIGF